MATTAAMGRLGSRRRSLANVFEIETLNIDQHNQLKFGYSSPQTKALLERNRTRRHEEELELGWESRYRRVCFLSRYVYTHTDTHIHDYYANIAPMDI